MNKRQIVKQNKTNKHGKPQESEEKLWWSKDKTSLLRGRFYF